MTVARGAVLSLCALLALAATGIRPLPARGSPPTPLAGSDFGFPGSVTHPASAASAGLALADRWLGDEPFGNPAASAGPHGMAGGAMLRVSRQDLRAGNRNFDATPAFFDGAGLALGLPARGRLAFMLYAFQPVLRFEDTAYSRGTGTPDPATPPAVIQEHVSARELRAGLAIGCDLGLARAGFGLEWTHRQDLYRFVESSGSPASGSTRLELTGDGLSAQAGVRLDRGHSSAGAVRYGLAVRYLPGLHLEAPHAETLQVGSTIDTLRARRQAGWELGVSARAVVSPAFRVLAALGGRTAQRWEGLDVRAGGAWEWKLAGEFHDERDPWTLRFGFGQERQSDVPEPRADVMGFGFRWQFAPAAVELGLVHRTLRRADAPNSFDDRLVLSVRTPR